MASSRGPNQLPLDEQLKQSLDVIRSSSEKVKKIEDGERKKLAAKKSATPKGGEKVDEEEEEEKSAEPAKVAPKLVGGNSPKKSGVIDEDKQEKELFPVESLAKTDVSNEASA